MLIKRNTWSCMENRMQDEVTRKKIDNSSFQRGGTVQIFRNNLNEQKFYSRRNEEQIEVRECLLSFSAE